MSEQGSRTGDPFVDAFIDLVIEFCEDNFDTPREAAEFMEGFFDMEPPWKKILRGEKL